MAKLNLENNSQRLTLGLSNEEFQRLDEMQKLTGAKTKADVIRGALQLLSVSTRDKELRLQPRVLPVAKSVTIVNRRLIDYFGKDPEKLRTVDPAAFETIVAELFEQEGYTVVQTRPRADGGKDLYVFKTDPFTRTMYLVECKRYVPPHTVGVEIVRQLYGVVQQERASGGIIVTTSYFTQPAKDFAQLLPYHLFLRDFHDLSRWLKSV